jgi:hypothetical protein
VARCIVRATVRLDFSDPAAQIANSKNEAQQFRRDNL